MSGWRQLGFVWNSDSWRFTVMLKVFIDAWNSSKCGYCTPVLSSASHSRVRSSNHSEFSTSSCCLTATLGQVAINCSIFCLERYNLLSWKICFQHHFSREDLNPLDELDLIIVPRIPLLCVCSCSLFQISTRCSLDTPWRRTCLIDFAFLELTLLYVEPSVHPSCLYLSIHLSKNGPQRGMK